jgi:serine/threonine protein kinase
MEYIDGAPLKGPLPTGQALRYAAQICDALDAAHRKGITHRDLKPANILVTRQGIKLLDFGLAKQRGPLEETEATRALTQRGAIIGTLNYMSPEQLQSKEADPRSDIFSFGLVLYEMLTGKAAFGGSSAAAVIAAVLERPAPSIADIAPPPLDRAVRKCLAKDPDVRWQTARDLKDELEWIASASSELAESSRPASGVVIAWATAAALAVAALLGWIRTSQPAVGAPVALSALPPSGKRLGAVGGLNVDRISPDGSMILFRADNRYHLRRLNSLDSEALPEWKWGGDAFWAPDSQSIAFPTMDRRLIKMRVPS